MLCEPDIKLDKKLYNLGLYIRDNLNNKLSVEDINANIKIVNSIFTADFPGINNLEYPILKIYRTSSNHYRDSNIRESRVNIVYGLTYPMLLQLPGLLNFVDYWMLFILKDWQFEEENMPYDLRLRSGGDSTTYSLGVNELTKTSYPYLRWNITIEE